MFVGCDFFYIFKAVIPSVIYHLNMPIPEIHKCEIFAHNSELKIRDLVVDTEAPATFHTRNNLICYRHLEVAR